MLFQTPCAALSFEIPNEWWQFAEMQSLRRGSPFYPYKVIDHQSVQVVPATLVEPPQRAEGVPPFKKYKLLPVFFAFQSPECELPAIEVIELNEGRYRYRVRNGYHRYYASVAVGFSELPVLVTAPVGHNGL